MAHVFDDGVGSADADILFAATGGAGTANFLIDINAGTDDRGIADAPGDFPGEPAGGGDAGHLAFGVQAEAIDGAGDGDCCDVAGPGEDFFTELRELAAEHFMSRSVLFDGSVKTVGPVVVATRVALTLLPGDPGEAALLGEEIFFFEAPGLGEVESALTDEHDVVGLFHDELGEAGDVFYVANAGDAAGAARRPVHQARVEFDNALLVGQAPETDGVIFRIVLDEGDSGDYGIESVCTAAHQTHGARAGVEAVAGRNDGVFASGRLGLCRCGCE